MSNVLQVKDLRIRFRLPVGAITAVDGVSFAVPEQRTVALVGESGSGKSVISQAVLRILPANADIVSGSILFRDPAADASVDVVAENPRGKKLRALRGGRMAIIFQEPMAAFSPLHKIGEQVEEALRLHRSVAPKTARKLVVEMLRLVGFPDPPRAYSSYPFELSGGLRQRAMIAMALVCRPALLIADEPTTALDVTIQAQILSLLKDLQQELGMAMLMITHDLGVVANLADEIVVLYRGRVMESGPAAELFERPGHAYLRSLLDAVPRLDRAPIAVARVDAEAVAAPVAPHEDALISIDRVEKRYQARSGRWFGAPAQSRPALAGVSLEIRAGECLGLVGESGCGKSTLSKIIMRAIRPDAGTVRFKTETGWIDLATLAGDALMAYRRRVQMVFQDPFNSLNPRLSVLQLVAEPLEIHGIGTPASRKEKVADLLRVVGLDPRMMHRFPHSFSGGQRQRIGLARALALEPSLLILDEPVSALDVSVQAQILALFQRLRHELGLTSLFVSHNLAVIRAVADRVAVMCAGRIVELAPVDALFRAPMHPYTRALLAAVPEPDPAHPLDLDALMEGRVSDPSEWPDAFRIGAEGGPGFVAVAPDHFVRANFAGFA